MFQKRDSVAIREDNLRYDLDCNNTTATGWRMSKNNDKEIDFMQLDKKLQEKMHSYKLALLNLRIIPCHWPQSLDQS